MNIELQEILCCHEWAIEPIAGQQLYNALMAAIASHQSGAGSEEMKKTAGYFLSAKKSFAGKLYVGDVNRINDHLYWNDEELADDDEIINVVVIEGAVTRNGGACTYGSKDHRDQILYANTIPQVIGHIFLINTPGGMVSAMPDYTMAIEDCKAKGRPIVAFIDGMCYSAGEWIACQCDRVITMNEEDGFGCIGAMCCGELAPHGAVNAVTQERTFIVVGKSSPDKNIEVREAAEGNDALLQAEADANTERFHEVVKAGRPMITDDLLTGKTFAAREVMGKLVDEVGTFDRAIEAIYDLRGGKVQSAREYVPAEPGDHEEPENHDDHEAGRLEGLTEQQRVAMSQAAAKPGADVSVDENGTVTETRDGMFGPASAEIGTTPKKNDMPEDKLTAAEQQEQEAAAAAQGAASGTAEEQPANQPAGDAAEQQENEGAPAEEPAADEQPTEETTAEEQPAEEAPAEEQPAEGIPAEEQPAEEASEQAAHVTIEEALELVRKSNAALNEMNGLMSAAKARIDELMSIIAAKDAAIATMESAVQERDEAKEALVQAHADIESLQSKNSSLKQQLEEAQASIDAKEAEIREMASGADEQPAAEVPDSNAQGAEVSTTENVITPGMTYEEIRAAVKARKKAGKK